MTATLTNEIGAAAHQLTGAAHDYDALLNLIGDARFALIGEETHGTHEFYRERAEITKRLITEKGFTAVTVEADWPDAYRVNRYVRGVGDAATSVEALGGFERFPTWMWRNIVVCDFVDWLRAHNDSLPPNATKVGFYGLDLYSLYSSIEAVLGYLDKIDLEAARRARDRYACFEHFGANSQAYGYATSFGAAESCENEVVSQLVELQRRATEYAQRDGRTAEDEYFYAEQNARLIKNAEEYYRAMFRGHVSSWNLRDRHMAGTLDGLVAHLDRQVGRAKVVVWEHNSHLGDARATGIPRFLLSLRDDGNAIEELRQPRLERAIGVIYRPETERISHYFHARLPDQFDALLHFDETRAVEPLERTPRWESGEPPETFPSGI